MTLQLLSHPLTDKSPLYGTNPAIQAELINSISAGATSNAHMIHLHNHSGTHVDAPRHFKEDGLTISDFPEKFWHFKRVMLLDIPKKADMLISSEEIEQHRQDIEGCELLLIRTGVESYRSSEPDRYRFHNPGFAPAAAHALRKYQQLRAIGVDLISITAYQNRTLGREAHHAFFDARYSSRFVVIEDLHLAGVQCPDIVLIEPVFRMPIDASPAVIVAIYELPDWIRKG
jgi:arylformamidase